MRYSKRTLLLICSLFISGCSSSSNPGDAPYTGEYMFIPGTSLEIQANKINFLIGEEVELRLKCYPRYNGKGHLNLQFLPQKQSSSYKDIIIDSPELIKISEYTYSTIIDLNSSEALELTWNIRVQESSVHFLYGFVYFDSVWIEKHNGYYLINADEAQQVYGQLSERPAANYPSYVLPEPKQE